MLNRPRRQRRRTRMILIVMALLSALLGTSNASGAAWSAPTPMDPIGHPGHAGVYAWGAATAKDGTILIGDYWNFVIRRYATDGTLLQTFSSRGLGPGQNEAPHGLATDLNSGDIYVADANGAQIDRFDATGTFLNSIDVKVPGLTGSYVAHIAVGPDGLIYAVNSHSIPAAYSRVLVFTPTGELVRYWGTWGCGPGQLGLLRGIAVAANGTVYLADAGSHLVQAYTPTGTFVRRFGASYFSGDMRGLAVDQSNGWLYVNDAKGSQIEKFSLDGTHLATFGSEGVGAGQFRDGGRDLAVGLDGTLYAPDYGNNRVLVFGTDTAYQRFFPDPAPQPVPDGFNQAQGLNLSPDGAWLYVADTYNHRVQRFDAATGQIERTWGFRGSTDGLAMNYPRDVAVDESGDVWLLNSRQGNVKHYRATGEFVNSFSKWGYTTPGLLALPRGIVVRGGLVFVADSLNLRINVYTPAGALVRSMPCGIRLTTAPLLRGCLGLGLGPDGTVYAASYQENVVYAFSPTGKLLGKLGKGTLTRPYDVAVYGGLLYVSEQDAKRISVLTMTGALVGRVTTAGLDGHPLSSPRGIAISPTGRIYVLDGVDEHIDTWQVS